MFKKLQLSFYRCVYLINGFLFVFFTVFGCSPLKNKLEISKESLFLKKNIQLDVLNYNKLISGYFFNPRYLGASFDAIKKNIIFYMDPKSSNLPNVFKFRFNKKTLFNTPAEFQVQPFNITNDRINQIKFDDKNIFYALVRNARQLVVYNNYKKNFISNLEAEVTVIQFSPEQNILYLGDLNGNLIIFDVRKKQLIFKEKLFNGAVTSIEFLSYNHALISGDSSTIFKFNLIKKEFTPFIDTESDLKKLLTYAGFFSCKRPRINQILILPEKKIIVTSHGWDYCRKAQVKIWNFQKKSLLKEYNLPKFLPRKIILSPNKDNIYIFDSNLNVFRIKLNGGLIKKIFNLEKSFVRFAIDGTLPEITNRLKFLDNNKSFARKLKPYFNQSMGLINDIYHFPESNLYMLSIGSAFKFGSCLVILKINGDKINHIGHLVSNKLMNFSLFLSNTLS